MTNLTPAILAGVSVFIFSQIFLRCILDPIIDMRKIMADISHVLLSSQHKITNGGCHPELAQQIQLLSARLRSCMYLIPYYNQLRILRVFQLPPKNNIHNACQELNSIKYNLTGQQTGDEQSWAVAIYKSIQRLRELLPIETTYEYENKPDCEVL